MILLKTVNSKYVVILDPLPGHVTRSMRSKLLTYSMG